MTLKPFSEAPKFQALVYDMLPWRKVPESDARSVWSRFPCWVSAEYKQVPKHLLLQSSGAVWKSRWTSWALVLNKPTVSVAVKQHFNQPFVTLDHDNQSNLCACACGFNKPFWSCNENLVINLLQITFVRGKQVKCKCSEVLIVGLFSLSCVCCLLHCVSLEPEITNSVFAVFARIGLVYCWFSNISFKGIFYTHRLSRFQVFLTGNSFLPNGNAVR